MYLLNGLFQAKGHIGGYFENKQSIIFNPLVFISQNASLEIIKLFKIMNYEFDNKLSFTVQELKSGKYNIKILSKNWNVIVNKWIPYFNKCYGNKYVGLQLLLKIYYLYYSEFGKVNKYTKYTLDHVYNGIKRIYLVYNLIDNSQITRTIPIKTKINLWLNNKYTLENIEYSYYENYINKLKLNLYNNCKTNFKLNFLFLHGFYLGDGTFNILIRNNINNNNLPWYIPNLIISKKNTIYNMDLFNLIIKYLESKNIWSKVRLIKDNSIIELSIESQSSIKAYSKLLLNYPNYYFNKMDQINLLIQSSKLFGKIKVWRDGHIALLKLKYNYDLGNINNNPNFDYNKVDPLLIIELQKYINQVNNYFNLNILPTYYISVYKETKYKVKLPIKLSPKYFNFNSNKNKNIALKKAMTYRDTMLKNWLKENNFVFYY